jgi:nitrogen-specific signal transduction histidine kinase
MLFLSGSDRPTLPRLSREASRDAGEPELDRKRKKAGKPRASAAASEAPKRTELRRLAHDLKNPLSGIRAAIELVGSNLPRASGDRAIVAAIIQRIDALVELIDERLTDVRRAPRRPRPK